MISQQRQFQSAPSHYSQPSGSETFPLAHVWILIVETNLNTAYSLALAFEQVGAEVITATSNREAHKAIGCILPDVLIVSASINTNESKALASKARQVGDKFGKQIAAIALTDSTTQTDPDSASEPEFHAHLCKPFEPNELVALTTQILGRSNHQPVENY